MNWISFQRSNHTQNFVKNWTGPFFENVLYSLNSSVYGPQAIRISKPLEHYGDDTFLNNLPPTTQYAIVALIFLIITINGSLLKRESLKNVITLCWPPIINLQSCLMFVSLLMFILISPFLISICMSLYLYKNIVKIMLKNKYKDDFVSMMDSLDVIWAIEDDNARSVINVISLVEPQYLSSNCHSGCLLNKIRKVVLLKLLGKNSACPKMFYKRGFDLGYHFWLHNENKNIEDYIKPMNIPEGIDMNEDNLQKYVQEQSNSPLPNNNTSTWEMLISKRPLKGTRSFPILFRLHHSLGDGVALLNLLLNTIGTSNTMRLKFMKKSQLSIIRNCIVNLSEVLNLREFLKPIIKYLISAFKFVLMLCMMPGSLLNQVLRPPDNNLIHGPELEGDKIISWVSDEHLSESLLVKIKRLRKKIPGVTFSELILTALSMSLQKYFSMKNKTQIPEIITAVVPVRMASTSPKLLDKESDRMKLKMENKFSVAMLTIPLISSEDKKSNSILKRLIAVRRETNKLRCSADFYLNYWIMKLGGCVMPQSILKPMLASVQASMVVSNLPGPSDLLICGEYKLKKMAFFVPHRGTTGIGFTILSCNERINLGMMIDSALVKDNEDGNFILRNVMKEIESLDDLTSNR